MLWFQVKDNRIFNGPFGRSLCSLTPPTLLTRLALRPFALQRSASPRIHGLAHSFSSLFMGQLNIMNICPCCNRVKREETRLWASLETRPRLFPPFLAFSSSSQLRRSFSTRWLRDGAVNNAPTIQRRFFLRESIKRFY